MRKAKTPWRDYGMLPEKARRNHRRIKLERKARYQKRGGPGGMP